MRWEYVGEVASTQAYLHARWRESFSPMYGVWTDRQHSGYGRKGDPWYAPYGENLSFSYYACTGLSPAQEGAAVALALVDTLAHYASHVEARIKWPNDIYMQHKKVAGILIQSRWHDKVRKSLIGIGVNVYTQTFPPRLSAVSLAQLGIYVPSMEDFLLQYSGRWERYQVYPPEALMSLYQKKLYIKGAYEGKNFHLRGITAQGFLRWDYETGESYTGMPQPCRLQWFFE
ncbi:MAG: biotin--[acetyl-CoA-carboxylase] ligase [Bacteroidia bacterium]